MFMLLIMKYLILTLLSFLSYSASSQYIDTVDFRFIANYSFAEKLVTANGVLLIDNSLCRFGTIDNDSDTTWADPFSYELIDNKVYIIVEDEKYLQYSDQMGANVFSFLESEFDKTNMSTTPCFVASNFTDEFTYNSRECLYFENIKVKGNNKTIVVCVFDKNLKIPVYYEISMFKFDKISSKTVYYTD